MSSSCVDFLLYEIQKNFNENSKNVCQILLSNNWSTLKEIHSELKHLKSKEILSCLENLIKYNIVIVNYDELHTDSYQFSIENFISYIISIRFLLIVNNKFDNLHKIIFEMFYMYGNLCTSELLDKIRIYIEDDDWINLVINATEVLINEEILENVPSNFQKRKTTKRNPNITYTDEIKRILSNKENPTDSRKRVFEKIDETESNIDKELRINNERFRVLSRNEIFIQDAILTLGEDAGMVFKIFIDSFDEEPVTSYEDPMSLTLFSKKVKKRLADFDDDKLEECLYLLSKDESVTYIDERLNSNGILLYYDPLRIVEQLVMKIITEIVQTIYGDNGLRIFLFVLNNPYIEEMSFRNLVIMSANQINPLLTAMVTRGFITRCEFSKTKQYFDEALVSLFHVDLLKIVRNERETCYQCLYRLGVRKEMEVEKKRVVLAHVIENSEKIKLVKTDEEDPIKDITKDDLEAVEFINKASSKFDSCEYGIYSNLILFNAFIQQKVTYHNY